MSFPFGGGRGQPGGHPGAPARAGVPARAPPLPPAVERDRKGGTDRTRFAFPTWWHYDVLRGLEYQRRGEGRWTLETRYPGRIPVVIDAGEGHTLLALRVLDWYSA